MLTLTSALSLFEFVYSRPTKELTQRSYDLHIEHGKLFKDTLYRSMDCWSVSVHPKSGKKKLDAENLSWVDSACVSGLSHLSGEEATAQVHPLLYTQAIFTEATSRGAVFVQAEAKGFLPATDSQPPRLVLSATSTLPTELANLSSSYAPENSGIELGNDSQNHFVISADLFVVCLGCWSDTLLSHLLKGQEVMSAICASSIVLQPSGPVPNVALFTDWFCPGEDSTYDPEVYPRPDGTLYICARADVVSIPKGGPSSVIPQTEVTDRILQYAAQLSPLLESCPILATQACLLPTTDDDTPIIGELLPQVYVATGHSCWGILNAPATGEVIAQLIHEGRTDLDISAMDPKRFLL